jgi:predicted nuclease with RNAse H fold
MDSPLCLPLGRTRVTDDDPARHSAGIMRVSERILKRRGINVYPCLLPSMQRLTERGIRLAAELRSRGIPVIECYPGAAQDIMGIPRKGAGEEWLKLGLAEFGVTGPFTSDRLTHDELDAITCSLVGSFYIAGFTEALGGDGEEPMFVPRLPL